MHVLDTPVSPLYPDRTTIDGTIVQSRAPIFALMTALTCILSACLSALRGSWGWSATSIATSAIMGILQIHVVLNSPILVIRGPLVTLYRRGTHAGSFAVSDLVIAKRNLLIAFALLAMVLTSMSLGALGLSPDLDMFLALRLSFTQRLILTVTGVWFAGAAFSLSYLDFPRRKLLVRGASKGFRIIYFSSRKQRNQLLTLLRALQLEEAMRRVGLGSHIRATELRDAVSPLDRRNGARR